MPSCVHRATRFNIIAIRCEMVVDTPDLAYSPNGVERVLVVGDAILDAFECGRN
jgi:hypothetical protein